jgi:hypothetical protein
MRGVAMTKGRSLVFAMAVFLVVGLAGCGGGGSDSSYQNRLTFGTGIAGTGFDLVGESTTFSVALLGSTGQIWFKLESAADMAGRAVRLYINDGTYAQKDYTNPQDYGHYFLSSFRITDVGSFTVKAFLVEQVGPDIGKETSVAQATIAMTP